MNVSSFLDLLCKYLRVEIEGFDHIPVTGAAVIIANHSGFSGFDAILLRHLIRRHTGREPRILAHRGFFDWSRLLRKASFEFLLREPHVSCAIQTLQHEHLLIVFPEGESGNFKASASRYQLQPFHSGFLRLAREAKVPVISCAIIGAEETHLNLGNIDLNRWVSHLRIPIPVNLFPLPAKWKIKVLKVASPKRNGNLEKEVKDIQSQMQAAIDYEIKVREYVFFGK